MDTEGLSLICAGLGIAEEDDNGNRIGYSKGQYCLGTPQKFKIFFLKLLSFTFCLIKFNSNKLNDSIGYCFQFILVSAIEFSFPKILNLSLIFRKRFIFVNNPKSEIDRCIYIYIYFGVI